MFFTARYQAEQNESLMKGNGKDARYFCQRKKASSQKGYGSPERRMQAAHKQGYQLDATRENTGTTVGTKKGSQVA
jgi:hypothetical protein